MATVTISGAGAHASAAATDRIPASKAGVKGYLTNTQIATLFGFSATTGALTITPAQSPFSIVRVDANRAWYTPGATTFAFGDEAASAGIVMLLATSTIAVTGPLAFQSSFSGTGSNIDTSLSRNTAGVLSANTTSANNALASILKSERVVVDADGGAVSTAQSNTYFSNEGAGSEANFTLPTAAANLTYTFITQDNSGLKVTANTGDTIAIGASVSAAAGNIASTTIGSTVKLVAINATEWVAVSATGTWIVT